MSARPQSAGLIRIITGILILFLFLTMLVFLAYPRIFTTESIEPNVSPEKFLKNEDLLDTCTFLLCQRTNRPGWGAEDAMKGCIRGEGQSLWLLLRDRVDEKEPLSYMVKEKVSAGDYKTFREDTSDGVLCFFYGLGSSNDIFKNNLFILLRPNVLSGLLPWQKRIDMIFLPTPGPLNTGGLDFVLSNKPSLPIFRPPPPPMSWVNYMIDMPEGYTRLTDRVSSLVLPFQGGGEEEGRREMELIIRVGDGVAVLSGEGRAGFFNIIETVEKKTGKPIYYYLGGTGFMAGMRNENTLNRLRALKERHPPLKIYANHSTSAMGEEMIHSVFGTDFILAYPGERIKLTAPQREE